MRPEDHYENLLRLSQSGGSLSSQSPFATVMREDLFRKIGPDFVPRTDRAVLHETIVQGFFGRHVNLGYDRQAVIMAGPPGAGKSSTMARAIDDVGLSLNQFAVLDADVFKQELLRSMIADGSIEDMIPPDIRRDAAMSGEIFLPLDFAGLVHFESTLLLDDALNAATNIGANVVVDGALSDVSQGRKRLNQLSASGYQSMLIVDVEASRRIVEERVYRRWLLDYQIATSPSANEARGLGGRLVPVGAIDWVFDDTGLSKPLKTARRLEEEFRDSVRLVVYVSSYRAGPELEYDSAAGGAVIHDPSGQRPYATCIVCHRKLYSLESMRLGMGRSCAERVSGRA